MHISALVANYYQQTKHAIGNCCMSAARAAAEMKAQNIPRSAPSQKDTSCSGACILGSTELEQAAIRIFNSRILSASGSHKIGGDTIVVPMLVMGLAQGARTWV